jgi:hypothetical protein
VLFGLPAALGPRRIVSELAPGTSTARPLGRRAWLFWEDLSFEANFEHPSILLLVDDRNGRILRRQRLSLYPLIDGAPAPFIASPGAYQDPSFQVFGDAPGTGAQTAQAADWGPLAAQTPGLGGRAARTLAHAAGSYSVGPGANNGPFAVKPSDLANDCLVVIGYRGRTVNGSLQPDRLFAGDVPAMEQWASDVGLRTEESGPTPSDLNQTVNELAGPNATPQCKDVLIYLHGHGVPPPTGTLTTAAGETTPAANVADTGPAGVISGVTIKLRRGKVETAHADEITPNDIINTIETFPSTTFKLKIDS